MDDVPITLAYIVSAPDTVKVDVDAAAGAARVYEVDLRLTRYDKGNAFARAMVAGLGTFAWGGIYGAATSIEGIEDTFADGVAAAVTGQKGAPPKQKT